MGVIIKNGVVYGGGGASGESVKDVAYSYTGGGSSTTIVGKLTVTNTDGTDKTYDVIVPSSSVGDVDYHDNVINKPEINGVTLDGNKSLEDLGVKQAVKEVLAQAIVFENGVLTINKVW